MIHWEGARCLISIGNLCFKNACISFLMDNVTEVFLMHTRISHGKIIYSGHNYDLSPE